MKTIFPQRHFSYSDDLKFPSQISCIQQPLSVRCSFYILFCPFLLLFLYSVSGRSPYFVLAAAAAAGSVMVSYARARAESLIPLCKVGFMERPERLVLLILGGLFNRMGPVLWVIAVVSTLTVIHRIYFTWQETRAGRVLPGIRLSL